MTDFAYSCANGRTENFDTFFYGELNGDLLISVYDGMKKHINKVSSSFARTIRNGGVHLSLKGIVNYLKNVRKLPTEEEVAFCTCRLHNNNITVEWCGTNRVYLIREGVLYQLTSGINSENWDGKTLSDNHKFTISAHEGDVIFMCTDGAYGRLTDSFMQEMWKCNPYMGDFCMSLIEESRKTGCRDNQTIVAFGI